LYPEPEPPVMEIEDEDVVVPDIFVDEKVQLPL
jgi:hypothetical protein